MSNYKKYYQDFLAANKDLIHMAAHSHHYWPDCVKEAIDKAYDDARSFVDLKWNKIFNEIIPSTENIIKDILNLSPKTHISFASNTHELLVRVISCFKNSKIKRILTTTQEFHSARRQFLRLQEEDDYEVEITSKDEILNKLREKEFDLIYISHVFFDTGEVISNDFIRSIIELKKDALFLLDGYHSFCAIPIDLSKYQNDLFYLAGSYKYAQAGEGLCFMSLPRDCNLRPQNTGWFASFETLESANDKVEYSNNGNRFAGATRDFTAHYRFNEVWGQFFKENESIEKMDQYIKELQAYFLKNCSHQKLFCIKDLNQCGHFLSLKLMSHTQAQEVYQKLLTQNILTDFRGPYLRFGFGLYLDKADLDKVLATLNDIKA